MACSVEKNFNESTEASTSERTPIKSRDKLKIGSYTTASNTKIDRTIY